MKSLVRSIAILAIVTISAPSAVAAIEEAPTNPRAHLDEILNRPEYQHWKLRQVKPGENDNYDSRLLESIFESYGYVFEKIGIFFKKVWDGIKDLIPDFKKPDINLPNMPDFEALSAINIVGWVAFGVLLIVLVITLYRHIKRTGLLQRGGVVLTRERVREALETGEALAMDGEGWLNEADRLLADREFRAVYRALYLALLSGLHSAGKIDFRRSRTNWTYVSKFRGPDDEKSTFSSLTSVFDETWYGRKNYEQGALPELRAKVSRLLGTETAHA